MNNSFHPAARRTALVKRLAYDVGASMVSSPDPLEELSNGVGLLAFFGVKVPMYVTKSQVLIYQHLKGNLQELALACQSILRYHDFSDEFACDIIAGSLFLSDVLNETTVQKAKDNLVWLRRVYRLDHDGIPTDDYVQQEILVPDFCKRARLTGMTCLSNWFIFLEKISQTVLVPPQGMEIEGLYPSLEVVKARDTAFNVVVDRALYPRLIVAAQPFG